jgi:predicted MFS family arabinose efflux permease
MSSSLSVSFQRLAWSNLAAQSAEQLSLAATPLVAVLLLGAGAGEVGLLATAQTLPFLLLSIPAGLLADRSSRRGLMIAAEGLRCLSLLILLALVMWGSLTLGTLTLLGFVGAVGTVGFSVAAPALVPSLVAPSLLARANGRLELARSLAYAGGPAVAGALVSWAGAPLAFALAASLSGAGVVLLFLLTEAPRSVGPARHPLQDLAEGARQVWHHPLLKPIFNTAVIWNIAWFVLQAAYVPYAVKVLGLSAATVGFSLGVFGLGMVAGALLSTRVFAALPLGLVVQLGPYASVCACALIAATLIVPSPVLVTVGFFVFGVGGITWTISSTTLRQTVTPGPMLGRVSAIFLTCNAGARPLGAALGGLVGAHWGESACLIVALSGFALQAAMIGRPALRSLKVLPAQAH